MRVGTSDFSEVWFADFEFVALPGSRPTPVCVVALELESERSVRIWTDELMQLRVPPYSTSKSSLVVAYYASAEIGCHLALDWPLPTNVLDLFTEFRNTTNGTNPPQGTGLLGALAWFGLDALPAAEKHAMRDLVMRGEPWSESERRDLLNYCESDVVGLSRLFNRMLPSLDIDRALLRGRYMVAAAKIEFQGVPIDTKALFTLRQHWDLIEARLICEIDAGFGIFEGRTFKVERWAKHLAEADISWPQLASGALDLSDETFREMARLHPSIASIRELRWSLSQMRLEELAIGKDGRNRAMLSAFRARTGRNQPSNKNFIFGPSVWLRGLIRPNPGFGLAYIDWDQQEFGIAAALSGDFRMIEAYKSGDAYIAFARQTGAVPLTATKETHPEIRELYKACALAVQYGMGEESLAIRIGKPVADARELLRQHRETYRTFWKWSDAAVDYAMLYGFIRTVFGWTVYVGLDANPRSFRNFPMQANGAEMLRLACCLATERGVSICAPVHDAILIEAPIEQLEASIGIAQEAMKDASEAVLDGFALRSGVKTIRYPDRYEDGRGQRMWQTVQRLLGESSTSTCSPEG